jgi:HPr kinase/phosphorylase
VKPTAVSADVLFEEFRSALRWEWVAGLGASERKFDESAVQAARSGADLVGYLNYIHPGRVQILGEREIAYLSRPSQEDCMRRVSRIVTLEPPVLVLADGQQAPDTLLSMCERAQIPMFATKESSAFVIDVLRAYLSKHFADRASMHGVFMDILGMGVLITGESGLGKSELGLELISRGNGLVADDAVDFYRINQTTIEGRCPDLLQNLLEVRGIGLLDIKAIFGETAVRRKMRLKLIVHLVRRETLERDYERLPSEPITQDVLGVPVRKVVIQVVAGRNIAVLVEAAVRNSILQLRGIDTYQEFVARQRKAMDAKCRTDLFGWVCALHRRSCPRQLRLQRAGCCLAARYVSPAGARHPGHTAFGQCVPCRPLGLRVHLEAQGRGVPGAQAGRLFQGRCHDARRGRRDAL